MTSAVPVPMSLLMSKVPVLAPSAALLLADSLDILLEVKRQQR